MTNKLKKKRRKKRKKNMCTKHHLCWTRTEWASEYANRFRNHKYCIMSLPLNGLHEHIHNEMDGIPAPSEENAKDMYEQLEVLGKYNGISERDSIEKRLKLLIALFTYIEQPTADALSKELEIVKSYSKKPR